MFKQKPSSTKSVEIETHVGAGVWFEGELNSNESIRLDGFFKGNVTVSDTLIIGETGKVLGHIKAKNLMCAGKIQGNIDIEEVAEFMSGGAIVGDINTGSLVMPMNVYFKGSCNMKNGNDNAEIAIEKEPAVTENDEVLELEMPVVGA